MGAQVSIAEAKAKFAALVAQAEAGEEIIVTRNGRPVARLGAIENRPVVFGDMMGVYFAEDLSLPADILDDFEPRG